MIRNMKNIIPLGMIFLSVASVPPYMGQHSESFRWKERGDFDKVEIIERPQGFMLRFGDTEFEDPRDKVFFNWDVLDDGVTSSCSLLQRDMAQRTRRCTRHLHVRNISRTVLEDNLGKMVMKG